MLTRTEVVAAATRWAGARLDGPAREARIVHAGVDAIYLDAGGACVGVLSRSAVAVPCGLQTTLGELPAPPVRDGTSTALIGDGRLGLGTLDVRVGRTVDASVPQVAPATGARLALGRALGDRLDPVRSELPGSALAALQAGDPAAVPQLLGRGSGLTPVGDDVLCGWLATRRALGDPADTVGFATDALATDGTTLLSATLLRRAAAGDVIPAFRRLLLGLRTGAGVTNLDAAVETLLATGHTSGAGMLLGCTLALDKTRAEQRSTR